MKNGIGKRMSFPLRVDMLEKEQTIGVGQFLEEIMQGKRKKIIFFLKKAMTSRGQHTGGFWRAIWQVPGKKVWISPHSMSYQEGEGEHASYTDKEETHQPALFTVATKKPEKKVVFHRKPEAPSQRQMSLFGEKKEEHEPEPHVGHASYVATTAMALARHEEAKREGRIRHIAKPGTFAIRSSEQVKLAPHEEKQGYRLYGEKEYRSMLHEHGLKDWTEKDEPKKEPHEMARKEPEKKEQKPIDPVHAGETRNTAYFMNNPDTGKIHLHFEPSAFHALSDEQKAALRSDFSWNKDKGHWASKNSRYTYRAENTARTLGAKERHVGKSFRIVFRKAA